MKDPWRLHQQNSFINILPQNPPRLRILHTSMQLHEDLAFWLYPSLHKVRKRWELRVLFEYREKHVSQQEETRSNISIFACWRSFFFRQGWLLCCFVFFGSCMLLINVQSDRIVRTWDLASLWLMIGLRISWNSWKPKVVNENTDDFVIIVYILYRFDFWLGQRVSMFFPFVLNDMNREI